MSSKRSDIQIVRSGKKSTCIISLEGELMVNNVTEIKEQIGEALAKCDSVQLRIHQVTSIDLSWIQLFHSIKRTCEETCKDMATEITLPSEIELLFLRTGFNSLLKGTNSNNQTTR
jgi:anti-anti-sigma factor